MTVTQLRSQIKIFGVVLSTVIALYLVNALLLGKWGLFAFFSYNYSLAFQIVFLAVLTIVAYRWLRRSPMDRAWFVCAVKGAVIGYAISIGSLVLGFASFAQSNGLVASIKSFFDALSASPISFLTSFLYAAAITFGWLYGAVTFVLSQMLSVALKLPASSIERAGSVE